MASDFNLAGSLPTSEAAVLLIAGGEHLQSVQISANLAAKSGWNQQLLFPASSARGFELAGIAHEKAWELHRDGFISFPPSNELLDESQEMELRFIATLVRAGCDHLMMRRLLRGLPPPYAYNMENLYYDWSARCWRALPVTTGEAESAFSSWLDDLTRKRDADTLRGIAELASEALNRVNSDRQ